MVYYFARHSCAGSRACSLRYMDLWRGKKQNMHVLYLHVRTMVQSGLVILHPANCVKMMTVVQAQS